MAAAQTEGHEEDKIYRDAGKNIRKERKEERKTISRKQGTKASKQENRTQAVSIAANLPVSATKPRRGPCHTVFFLLSLATVSSVTAAAVQPSPPRTSQRKPNKTARTRGLSQLRFHLLAEPVPCHTIYHSISAFLRQQHKNLYIPLATLSTISFLHSSTAAYKTYIFPCLY